MSRSLFPGKESEVRTPQSAQGIEKGAPSTGFPNTAAEERGGFKCIGVLPRLDALIPTGRRDRLGSSRVLFRPFQPLSLLPE